MYQTKQSTLSVFYASTVSVLKWSWLRYGLAMGKKNVLKSKAPTCRASFWSSYISNCLREAKGLDGIWKWQ